MVVRKKKLLTRKNLIEEGKKVNRGKSCFWLTVSEVLVCGHLVTLILGLWRVKKHYGWELDGIS